MFLSFPCYVVLSFAYQVILILCIFLFCSFCILLFAHSRQRKLNLIHWGTIFSISFVHLSLKNKKLNLFHPILNIEQGKGLFCQKNLKTQSIQSHSKNKAGQRPILSKESKTRSIQSNFKYWAGQRPILSKESKNSIYSNQF